MTQHIHPAHSFIDLTQDQLVEQALKNGEGELCANQALSVRTGVRTGRSPKDRYIVKDELTQDTVAWGNINQPIKPEQFNELWARAENYIKDRKHYISHLQVGADPEYHLPVKVITDLAWHQLFVQDLFIRPFNNAKSQPSWTLMCTSGLATDPERDGTNSDGVIILNFKSRCVLLIGMQYAGEMKKAMFSVLNFLLTDHGILPMHCAANVGNKGDVALFFGLSGTGKTTLSADPERRLIGDDEHGWGKNGVFNFEGGCYAKCIDLTREREPVIWDAIRYGAVMENVVIDPLTKQPNYSDSKYTQNTRVAYPREHIVNRVLENKAGHPRAVIFLCCDLYGVLPPVALLTKEQAAYYFVSGYTALVGSTEMGQSQSIKPTFSTCFGAPFFPRFPIVYAELLQKRIAETGCDVYLVNTGWTGGSYGQGGKRFSIDVSRSIIHAIFNDEVKQNATVNLENFNFRIPKKLKGIDPKLLDPKLNYVDQNAFHANKKILIEKFIENFTRFDVPENIKMAGPRL